MNPQDWLEETRALCDAATEGPWEYGHCKNGNGVWGHGMLVASCGFAGFDKHNADHIAAARLSLPLALAWIRRLEKMLGPGTKDGVMVHPSNRFKIAFEEACEDVID